jgi:hypothetical protein
MAMNNAPPLEAVAKVILEAITSTNPLLRYQIGKDAEKFFKAKKEMTDENIHKSMVDAVLMLIISFSLHSSYDFLKFD